MSSLISMVMNQIESVTNMKTLTYIKRVEIEETIPFPIITFVAEKVRVYTGDSSWFDMGYTPRLDGLTLHEYRKLHNAWDRDIEKALEDYVKTTYNLSSGWGYIDYNVYSAKQLGMPELPKVDPKFNDDHADLVRMFKGA
jgi:hypothetical protein